MGEEVQAHNMRRKYKPFLQGILPMFPVNTTHAAFRDMPVVSSAIIMHFTGIWKAGAEVVHILGMLVE